MISVILEDTFSPNSLHLINIGNHFSLGRLSSISFFLEGNAYAIANRFIKVDLPPPGFAKMAKRLLLFKISPIPNLSSLIISLNSFSLLLGIISKVGVMNMFSKLTFTEPASLSVGKPSK